MSELTEYLRQGGLVAIPTETVYGLAASLQSEEGLRRIFLVKERPFFDPLIVHVASIDSARSVCADWPPVAQALAEKFWPGPLTLVLPKQGWVPDVVTSGLTTVGVRWPQNTLTEALINDFGPLAAPSANRFGRISPTCAQHVREEFPEAIAEGAVRILDGGPCPVGVESTILALPLEGSAQARILRAGGIDRESLLSVIQHFGIALMDPVRDGSAAPPPSSVPEAPGQLRHHYEPRTPLILLPTSEHAPSCDLTPAETEAIEKLNLPKSSDHYEWLELSDSPELAARELYSKLRDADSRGAKAILYRRKAVQDYGLWSAINDRLGRAARWLVD